MQTRLLASVAGGLIGVVVASPIHGLLGLTPTLALIACGGAGVALGCVTSIMFDVFAGSAR